MPIRCQTVKTLEKLIVSVIDSGCTGLSLQVGPGSSHPSGQGANEEPAIFLLRLLLYRRDFSV